MNGVGPPTVGRLPGHKRRTTTAIYAHLDDATLQDAAAQATAVIVKATGFEVELPPLETEAPGGEASRKGTSAQKAPAVVLDPWDTPFSQRDDRSVRK